MKTASARHTTTVTTTTNGDGSAITSPTPVAWQSRHHAGGSSKVDINCGCSMLLG